MTKKRISKLMMLAAVSVLMVLLVATSISAQTKSFTDVKGHWAEADILAAAEAGIINGYPDGTFKPEAQVIQQHFGFMLANAGKSVKVDNEAAVTTRELAAKFLVIGFGLDSQAVDVDAVLAPFADKGQIKAENKKYVAIAVKNGLLTGVDAKTFAPQGVLTRAQAAAVILRAKNKTATASKPAVTNEYVGSETCKGCHFDRYAEWKQTYHSKMIQDAREDGAVIGNFDTLPDPSLKPLYENARFVQGSKWKQRYLIKGKDGKHYILPYQWNVAKQTWSPYNKDTWQTKTWEKLCIGCHTTGYNPETGKYAEESIGCEACHGPGKEHVLSRGDRSKIVVDVTVNTCASCHNRGLNQFGNEYPVGWQPGKPFTAEYLNLVKPGSNFVYSGGWASGHHQQWQDWLLSAHARAVDDLKQPSYYEYAKAKGYCGSCHSSQYILAPASAKPAFDSLTDGVSCNVCHTPHSPGKGAGQLRQSRETTCTTCHTAGVTALTPGKTVRRADDLVNAGTGAIDVAVTPSVHYKNNVTCVDCHMTKVATTMNKYDISNHVFEAVTPVKAKELGLPTDSCSTCHKTSTPEIRQSYIEFWQGNTATKLAAVDALAAQAKAKVDANPNLALDVKALYDKAVSNISLVKGDRSKGVHNYEYTLKVLGQAEKDLKAFLEKTK